MSLFSSRTVLVTIQDEDGRTQTEKVFESWLPLVRWICKNCNATMFVKEIKETNAI